MARSPVIPPKTTLVVAMPPALLRALLLSKAALQASLVQAYGTFDPSAVKPESLAADALSAVNLVLGLSNDHPVSRTQLLSMADKA